MDQIPVIAFEIFFLGLLGLASIVILGSAIGVLRGLFRGQR